MLHVKLTPQQIDAIAESTQAIRREGKPTVTPQTAEAAASEDWKQLNNASKDYLRLTVRAVLQALEQTGFEIRQQETAGGAGR